MSDLANVVIRAGVRLREALEAITRSGKQVVLVLDAGGRLAGLVTDGDIRKGMLRGVSLDAAVDDVMNRRPVVAEAGLSRAEAIALMRSSGIRQLPLLQAGGVVADLLLLDELLAPPPPLRNLAVSMAGGEGRRLRPLTKTMPKPLLSIGGRSLLELLIERLRQSGLVDIIIAIHHKFEMIRERLGDGSRLGVRVEYFEEARPLGTMGALPLIREGLTEPVFVGNADSHQVPLPGHVGLPPWRGEGDDDGRSDPPSGGHPVRRADAGGRPGCALRGEAAQGVSRQRGDLRARPVPVAGYRIQEYWLDVGRLHDLEKANRDLAEGLLD